MKSALLVVAVLVGMGLGFSSPTRAEAAAPSPVTRWIDFELDTIASERLNPPRAARALAYASSAMYLAAVAGGGAPDEAVAGAASRVLIHLHPGEASRIDALAEEVADTSSAAFLRGRLIGSLLVARAENDGVDAVWTGTPPQGPGAWVPTPPAYVPPLEPLVGTWRPWNLETGGQFRPGPPPAYASPQLLAEMNEVYAVSQTLSEKQRRIADYWADGAGTVTPPGHWNMIAADLVRRADWTTLRSAWLFAALNTAQADAFIACWDAKYAYWSLRPVTAIRRLVDPGWLPHVVTPPFPSYVSGHSTTSGAASAVLVAFFPGRAAQLQAMAEEAAVSRLYGGIHFRSDNEVGLTLGRLVGNVALRASRVS